MLAKDIPFYLVLWVYLQLCNGQIVLLVGLRTNNLRIDRTFEKRLKFQQHQESMLCQKLHVSSDTQKISLLIGPNDIVCNDVA